MVTIKWSLMTFSYINRIVLCSTVLEKLPRVVDGKKYRDPQLNIFIHFLPSGLKELWGGVDRKFVRAKGGGGHKRINAFYTKQADTYMNSQKLWHHIQGLHRFRPDDVPHMQMGKLTQVPIPNPEAISYR